MTILNFSTLLNDTLQGKEVSLNQFTQYSQARSFNQQEIAQVLECIKTTINSPDALKKSYALWLSALWYQYGIGYELNLNKSIELYKESIQLNNTHAMNSLAVMHQYGTGLEQDFEKAIQLYEQALNLGNASAMFNRGYMHQLAIGCEQNFEKAIALYEQAIKLGNIDALTVRAHMYQHAIGGKQDLAKAIMLNEEAIKLNNAEAMSNRGFMYVEGLGSDQDIKKGIEHYEQAMTLRFAPAVHNRAYLYHHGIGSELNIKKAIELYELAIEYGYTESTQDLTEAREFYVNSTSLKIDEILLGLKRKIGSVDKHHFTEAYTAADNLLSELNNAKSIYLFNVKSGKKPIAEENNKFKEQCAKIIDGKKSILARDLSFGNYLVNLLKAIANALIWAVSFGQSHTFFKPVRSESIAVVEQAQLNLTSF